MNSSQTSSVLVWFRRDLRDFDHAALHHALRDAGRVYCAFVFDREILDGLPSRRDRRVEFIRESVVELDAALAKRGGGLIVRHARARDEIPRLAAELGVAAVYANRDYEPATRRRDEEVARALASLGVAWRSFKDRVIFECDEVTTQAGTPFGVYTPYRAAWLRTLQPAHLAGFATERGAGVLAKPPASSAGLVPSLKALGFEPANLVEAGVAPGMRGGAAAFRAFRARIDRYRETRDYPALAGPSHLSTHLRFGTVSIRELSAFAHARSLQPGGDGAAVWLGELVWREFFAQLLWHHPRVATEAFQPALAGLAFPESPERWAAWREGRTGYPIVDAAMRQLNATGYMHNRLRMIAASFLVKDLLIDWRRGERYFADLLLDYDLASNNGNWQWAASTGCDAQPWFRIFNPVTQSQRFDPDGEFIRRFVPELRKLSATEIHAPWRIAPEALRAKGLVIGRDYPPPIVDHAVARQQALELFGAARKNAGAPRGEDRRPR